MRLESRSGSPDVKGMVIKVSVGRECIIAEYVLPV